MHHHRIAAVTAGLAVAIALSGCSDDEPSSTSTPSASSTATASAEPTESGPAESEPAAAETVDFESSAHGVRLAVPADWKTSEGTGSWTDLAEFVPGTPAPGESNATSPDGKSTIFINSMPLPAGMTPDAWREALTSTVVAEYGEDCGVATSAGEVGGEPATVLDQSCVNNAIVAHHVVHGDRGYYFTTVTQVNDKAAYAELKSVVDSIEFTG